MNHHKLFPHERKVRNCLTGLMLILVGSWMSIGLEQHILPHLLQDAVAYFLHGLGSTPIIALLISEV